MPSVPILSAARIAVPGPTIIRTNVPTISAAKILRFDGPAAATDSIGIATGLEGAGSYAPADCGCAGSPGGGGEGDGGGGGGGTLVTCSSSCGAAGRPRALKTSHIARARRWIDAPLPAVVDTTAVQVTPLLIDGAFAVRPTQHDDARGVFLEWFRADVFRHATGHDLELAQANCSVSRAGVIRGIHYADVPPGQAKYVTCLRGAALDVVVDLRVGSPTFGRWDSVLLDAVDRRQVYLAEGLGHAVMALADETTLVYLCSTPYAPVHEHGIDPFDADIAVAWPTSGVDGTPLTPVLSDKD